MEYFLKNIKRLKMVQSHRIDLGVFVYSNNCQIKLLVMEAEKDIGEIKKLWVIVKNILLKISS
jgi:hypothetical protein